MLVSLRWLRDYVDIDISPAELAHRLTMIGLEVEAIRETGVAFQQVLVAKVLSVGPHPNADKLSLCEVTTGRQNYRVVCGAPNVCAGALAPLALVGATLPGGYTIKLSRIRGEVSEGMLCSEDELGIGEDHAGIMILPPDLALGMNLEDALDLRDTVLDISITPNRADCLSIIGIAREVAVLVGKRIRYPGIAFEELDEQIGEISSVGIIDPDLCPRYTARLIKNVTVKPSPLWMRQRLEAVGLRAINNIVDVTNFVMMEFGQPLHAFDYRYLEEGKIIVRRSQEGECFTSLDGKDRVLPAGTLLICDGVKPVAIAGIMGGLNSEVKDDTETVFLESAYFTPSSIRKSARWLGMNTDAAFRFERGIDPDGVARSLDRAAQLMASLSGGRIFRNVIDQYPQKVATAKDIPLRIERVNEILGTNIDVVEIIEILKHLEMDVSRRGDHYTVTPPTCRVDIFREIDLIEEVARFYGYDRVPSTMPSISGMSVMRVPRMALEDRIRRVMAGCGYSEVITYSFVSSVSVDALNIARDDERRKLVTVRNPLTEDQSVMRSTLVYSLLKTMGDNARSGCFNLKIYEIGKIFVGQEEGNLPVEKNHLGCLLTGARYDELWHFKALRADFYDLKGTAEKLFDDIKIMDLRFRAGPPQAFLHPGKSCDLIIGDQVVGFLGEIHPDVLVRMDLRNGAFVFEIDLDVLAGFYSEEMSCREFSRFPTVIRDAAFIVRGEVKVEEMIRAARGSGEELLDKMNIFDVYAGKGIPEGMKGLGLRFFYRSYDRTLTDEEVNRLHGGIVKRITDTTGAKIRGEE